MALTLLIVQVFNVKRLNISRTFSKRSSRQDLFLIILISSALTPQQASYLTAPFSRQEINDAVSLCSSQKTPGPDVFSFSFIKESWEIIRDDIYKMMVDNFWENHILPKGANIVWIALIPKVDNPDGFKDFRPISKVGCSYNIIAKLLARRLQHVMSSLIGPFQSSFIKGRQILDGALVAGELIENFKRKKIKSTILKLDFHKAFDNVSWSFLHWTLDKMGFPTLWRDWIKACTMNVAASILVNGAPSVPFKLHRGLRQGDPLSPFLFDLVVETLSLLIQKASSMKLWEGVEVGNGELKITHLQYADDTILFCPPNLDY